MKNAVLGRGLSALLKDELVTTFSENDIVKLINIEQIGVGDYQPRKIFDHDKLKELADSISTNGLLQPIIVCQAEEGKYNIVAGERRWRACKLAGLEEVPVIIKNLKPKEILEIALVENIQREELSVIEEAEAFERLIKEFQYTQEQIAQAVNKSRSHIANLLRLNQLPSTIKEYINEGKLSMGHARCLVGNTEAEAIANYILENDLSVRQTEAIVKNWSKREYTKDPEQEKYRSKYSKPESSNRELEMLARTLSERFGVKITIEDYPVGGKIIFHYNSLEQLDLILQKL
jgi:ParB family transcriptional regulator, chromosome partitioning protein